MKKVIIFLIAQFILTAAASAQINWRDYSQSWVGDNNNNSGSISLIVALRSGNDFLWPLKANKASFNKFIKDTAFRHLRPKDFIARQAFDTARAQFFLKGVGLENAASYEFRVLEYPGNRVIVPWHEVSQFASAGVLKSSTINKMAYLGGYKTAFGKMLIMDVRNMQSKKIIATSLVAWEFIKPVVTNIYTSKNLDEFFKKLQYPWAPSKQPTGKQSEVLKMPSTDNNVIFALKGEVFYKRQIQYELIRNGSIYRSWRYNDYDNSFVWIKDCPPGAYVIKIRFSGQPLSNTAEYRFKVEPAWYQTNLFRILAGLLLAAILGGFLFLMLYVKQKRELREEQAKKTKSQLELKAIYAQLNPHFIFNALSSIQGLINNQDIKGANNYLSDFARLMRGSLNNSNKDEISLEEEVKILDTYLKLEQLRFGFNYEIRVLPPINTYETGIPALLLQPLVENAVKHGVSALLEKGLIVIEFTKAENAMVVSISDNGKGFNEQSSSEGYGLKLTKDRIKLLNELNSEHKLYLSIEASLQPETLITLTFNDWFL
jgi:two-component system LytT family sensor kinase